MQANISWANLPIFIIQIFEALEPLSIVKVENAFQNSFEEAHNKEDAHQRHEELLIAVEGFPSLQHIVVHPSCVDCADNGSHTGNNHSPVIEIES